MNSSNSPTTQPIFRASQVVWTLLTILETALAFRLILKAFGANPSAAFTNFVYDVSAPFVMPFAYVFPAMNEALLIEWATVLAMVVYWLVAVGVARMLMMSLTVSTPEAAEKLADSTGGV